MIEVTPTTLIKSKHKAKESSIEELIQLPFLFLLECIINHTTKNIYRWFGLTEDELDAV